MSPRPSPARFNPFPGLRPFHEDEVHLFFGRESQVDTMVDKLSARRFLAVIGTSGSGKSSLVNCGLRPALRAGLMGGAGSMWRMAQFRPGAEPVRMLARALAAPGLLFTDTDSEGPAIEDIVEATLRVSSRGLSDIYEQSEHGRGPNLLVVADQFEEIFRYQGAPSDHGPSPDAVALVNLLLYAKSDPSVSIFVVLTMRSDFLGDCTRFEGLPEAMNECQYLVPRMTREERRAAIAGPVRVAHCEISPVLLTRLVNDVGDNPDQLSILQHALNRTWARWNGEGATGPLSLPHYESIGTMAHALDYHAEKAYAELSTDRDKRICEKIFKALTDRATDARGIRRPTRFSSLCGIADATPAETGAVIDVFRKPSRSFLMPPLPEKLEPGTMVDISHESLMRVWARLRIWTDEDAASAQLYRRISETAELHAAGKAGLWRDPDLQVAADWRAREQPTAAWTSLYGGGFETAMSFLDASEWEREREERESEAVRLRELEQARALADARARSARWLKLGIAVSGSLAIAAAVLGIWALASKRTAQAESENARIASQAAMRSAKTAAWNEFVAGVSEEDALDRELQARVSYIVGQFDRAEGIRREEIVALWELQNGDGRLKRAVFNGFFASPDYQERFMTHASELMLAVFGMAPDEARKALIREVFARHCGAPRVAADVRTAGACVSAARGLYPTPVEQASTLLNGMLAMEGAEPKETRAYIRNVLSSYVDAGVALELCRGIVAHVSAHAKLAPRQNTDEALERDRLLYQLMDRIRPAGLADLGASVFAMAVDRRHPERSGAAMDWFRRVPVTAEAMLGKDHPLPKTLTAAVTDAGLLNDLESSMAAIRAQYGPPPAGAETPPRAEILKAFESMLRASWSDGDEQFLRDYYPKFAAKVLSGSGRLPMEDLSRLAGSVKEPRPTTAAGADERARRLAHILLTIDLTEYRQAVRDSVTAALSQLRQTPARSDPARAAFSRVTPLLTKEGILEHISALNAGDDWNGRMWEQMHNNKERPTPQQVSDIAARALKAVARLEQRDFEGWAGLIAGLDVDANYQRSVMRALIRLPEPARSENVCAVMPILAKAWAPAIAGILIEQVLKWPSCQPVDNLELTRALAEAAKANPESLGLRAEYVQEQLGVWAQRHGFDVRTPPDPPIIRLAR